MEQHKKTKTQGLSGLQREKGNCPMKNRILENEIGPNVSVLGIQGKMESDHTGC